MRLAARETSSASNDRVRTVTAETFDALVIEPPGRAVVEFMSYGCVHCRVLEPLLQKVAQLAQGKGEVFRVNIAVEQDLADAYDVHVTPTLIMFLDGNVVGRVEGPDPTLAGLMNAVTQPFRARS